MKWLIPIALLIAGCAGNPPEPEIITKEVRVPVPVACVEEKDIPPMPVIDKVTKESSPGEKIQVVVIHNQRLSTHASGLQALLVSCTKEFEAR